ncbi:MAG: hypothetical protein ULS35scaffold63_20 [Phage 33_17]|nr:MAG: hypothetical protein ULS35scaffold63_20 [Phage 33_17]
MRPIKLPVNLADVPDTVNGVNYDLTHFVANFTSNAYTLARTATTDGQAHIVSIQNNDNVDHSNITITLTGTDVQGNPQTEIITGPTENAIVVSTKFYKTLTTVFLSGSIVPDSFDIGIQASIEVQPIPVNYRKPRVKVSIDTSVTIDYGIQYSQDKIQQLAKTSWIWFDIANSLNNQYNIDEAPTCLRVLINSYNSGDNMTIFVSQQSDR